MSNNDDIHKQNSTSQDSTSDSHINANDGELSDSGVYSSDDTIQNNSRTISDSYNTVSKSEKKDNKKKNNNSKKKKKRNLWPLKAMIISLFLSASVNIASEMALSDAQIWLTYGITALIVLVGVFFDMIGTASTACDIQPFLAMASRKVKGAKTAVKLAKSSDAVSSVCNDIVGDICGIVSGVCAATIVATQVPNNIWLSVLVYALISTATITLKAVGKGFAVKQANKIIFATAKVLSIFKKEG